MTSRRDPAHPSVADRGRRLRRVGGILAAAAVCLLGGASGCAAFKSLDGVPVGALPPDFRAPVRSGLATINLALLRRTPPPQHLVDSGDVLAVYVEGVLGAPEQPPPVSTPAFPLERPAVGYPIVVREDGTLALPSAGAVDVRGLTLPQVEAKLRREFTERRPLLRTGRERVLVSLQRPRTYSVLVIRQESGNRLGNLGSAATVDFELDKRGTGRIVELPVPQNDVLHALAATGGLPGLDAENVIYVLRGPRLRAAPPAETPPGVEPDAPADDPAALPGDDPAEFPARVPRGRSRRRVAGVARAVAGRTGVRPRRGFARRSVPPVAVRPAGGVPPEPHGGARAPRASRRPRRVPPAAAGGAAGADAAAGAAGADARSLARRGSVPGRTGARGPLRRTPHEGGGGGRTPRTGRTGPPARRAAADVGGASAGGRLRPRRDGVPGDVPGARRPRPRPVHGGPGRRFPAGSTMVGPEVLRIPVRLEPGRPVPFTEEDITLYDGDVVFVEQREADHFYTGGLLGGGQYQLPQNYDIDVLEALAIVRQRGGAAAAAPLAVGGPSSLNQDVTVGASRLIILRKDPFGGSCESRSTWRTPCGTPPSACSCGRGTTSCCGTRSARRPRRSSSAWCSSPP